MPTRWAATGYYNLTGRVIWELKASVSKYILCLSPVFSVSKQETEPCLYQTSCTCSQSPTLTLHPNKLHSREDASVSLGQLTALTPLFSRPRAQIYHARFTPLLLQQRCFPLNAVPNLAFRKMCACIEEIIKRKFASNKLKKIYIHLWMSSSHSQSIQWWSRLTGSL